MVQGLKDAFTLSAYENMLERGVLRLPKQKERPKHIVVRVDEGVVEMPCGSRWRLQKRIILALSALASRPKKLTRPGQILSAMYGHPDNEPEWGAGSMKNAISHLRRAGLPITTRYGQGYVLEAEAVVVKDAEETAEEQSEHAGF